MLNVVSSPVGVDVPIRKFQEKIHPLIMAKWGLDPLVSAENALYQSYGRAYKNRKDSGYVAEVFTSGTEYKDVYWDDTLNAISFFGIGQQITHAIKETVDVHLVFFVDLAKVKPAITNKRADEEVRLDLLNIIQTNNFGFRLTGMELGIENVLKEYPGTRRDERLKYVDMHPVHCFRLNFSLTYDKNICY